MTIRTTLRFHLTPVRMTKSPSRTIPTTDTTDVVGKRNTHSLLVRMQAGTATLKVTMGKKSIYHMTQLFHYLAYAQRTAYSTP